MLLVLAHNYICPLKNNNVRDAANAFKHNLEPIKTHTHTSKQTNTHKKCMQTSGVARWREDSSAVLLVKCVRESLL